MDTCTTGKFIGIVATGLIIDDGEVAEACIAKFPNDFMADCHTLVVGGGTVLPRRQ
ncbi:hypothetical protein [Mesorhizobium sp. ANAO-SY3R2]|uniref:hypothetical protein n=1 Tax=Mesorhizobium sp. ANAO-SY3R2 TaxID=3166644 RepID=UPI00366DE7FC